MRIVAGRFRRRRILTNAGLVTRPIPDRVKEILFERLGGELNGERVADVFAGTGTIGLEALSRGASSVVFFEKDRMAASKLRENIAQLEIEDETLCWQTDVLRTSFQPKGVDSFWPYDLVFFDPPFPMLDGLSEGKRLYRSIQRLGRDSTTAADARLFLRTPVRQKFDLPDTWQTQQTLRISSMEIHICVKPTVD